MTGAFTDEMLDGHAHVVPGDVMSRLSGLSDGALQALASAQAAEMTRNEASSETAASQHVPEDAEAFAAMCAIVATCARDGEARTPAERRQQLDVMGVEDEALQMKLLPVLAAAVPSVERVLENSSFDFAHVVDVSWRVDYVLRSSSAGSVHEPLYFVQLKLQSPSATDAKLQTLVFSCSVEELRSLVYKVQEAANEVEKLAAGTTSQLRTSA